MQPRAHPAFHASHMLVIFSLWLHLALLMDSFSNCGSLCGALKPSVDLLRSCHELSQSLSKALGTSVLSPRAALHEPSLANHDLAIGPPSNWPLMQCNSSAFKSHHWPHLPHQ
ncbi:hypothetical protein GOP47_0020294 [Adiantum capillus-veneris]|uniref:Secreted protein n=1 Tax=Adiantum capillus-veneris TaxID=13818 RepID=A0A9D4UCQ6_ADICA|nr:hypothetical protein GOP47_0020294 [Adiantum capillus-veneris]